jgi:3-oxoacyl-[acyl-carrier-protein] synthase-1/3-oxoacyl-[acyl-carrier-protein] synthase II
VRPIAIVAAGAVSALGTGEAAFGIGAFGGLPPSAVARDDELSAAGFERPYSARIAIDPGELDRASAWLDRAARELRSELDCAWPAWRGQRIAVLVGTSGGGMPSLERALADCARGVAVERERAAAAFYAGPLAVLSDIFGGARCIQILAACASSTFAIGLASRWLEAGHADLVIAGGYDALSPFIASGFESLGATARGTPQPFRLQREGMILGEGAGLVALGRVGEAPPRLGVLLGFGASSDASHITAPEPTGDGLVRAARAALADAAVEPSQIELVSAHATATLHNDAAEATALSRLLGSVSTCVVHPYKASIGHTLGAAGVLELLAALLALREGVLPAAWGAGAVEAAFPARLLERNQPGRCELGLKLSSAFGGANATVVFGAQLPARPAAARSLRPVRLSRSGRPLREPDAELLATSALPEVVRTRLDRASALAVSAAAELIGASALALPERTAVVVGTFAASLEANEQFDERRRSGGVKAVAPRRFPATSPNLPAGQCSIGFGLRGPALAVGGGPHAALEALLVAYDLVAAGDAEAALVIACDDVGSVTRALCTAAGCVAPSDGAFAVLIDAGGMGMPIERAAIECSLNGAASSADVAASSAGWPALLALVERLHQTNH